MKQSYLKVWGVGNRKNKNINMKTIWIIIRNWSSLTNVAVKQVSNKNKDLYFPQMLGDGRKIKELYQKESLYKLSFKEREQMKCSLWLPFQS